jgi:hypothetical protein
LWSELLGNAGDILGDYVGEGQQADIGFDHIFDDAGRSADSQLRPEAEDVLIFKV